MESLTKKQRKILDFIERKLANNILPSQQEIADHFAIAQNSVYQFLCYLKEKGYLEDCSLHRGLRLSKEYLALKEKPIGLPLVGRVAAGAPILAEENITDYMDVGDLVKKQHKDAFILQIVGDSMINDGILNGDYVVVKPQSTIENGQIGVAAIEDEATVKRIFVKAGKVVLKPSNSKYKDIVYKRDDENVRIIGIVIGCFRRI
ncbi:MAG: repressor LexA [Planctomycetes bacterium GWF2_41_51]|nr:MAG: repressor LexA [Planctomycetes bacterium GWF2_41_51]